MMNSGIGGKDLGDAKTFMEEVERLGTEDPVQMIRSMLSFVPIFKVERAHQQRGHPENKIRIHSKVEWGGRGTIDPPFNAFSIILIDSLMILHALPNVPTAQVQKRRSKSNCTHAH